MGLDQTGCAQLRGILENFRPMPNLPEMAIDALD